MVSEKATTTTSKAKTTARRSAKTSTSTSPEAHVITANAAKTKTAPRLVTTTTKGKTNGSGRRSKLGTTVTLEQRNNMIAEAAYFRALNRGWQHDNTVHDWLHAEAEIDELLQQKQ